MKSEKALESLTKSIKALNDGRLSLFQKLNVKQIEKDLDVLEILKSHLHLAVVNSVQYGNKDIVLMIDSEDKDFNKIKEWLENERK